MGDATFALLAINEYKKEIVSQIEEAIKATNLDDEYSVGVRNGMRFCKFLIDEIEPEYEEIKNSPLTMEYFSQLIDTEPIWCEELQEWYLFLAYDDGENEIQLMTDKGDIETFDEDDLEKYPLYRRHD